MSESRSFWIDSGAADQAAGGKQRVSTRHTSDKKQEMLTARALQKTTITTDDLVARISGQATEPVGNEYNGMVWKTRVCETEHFANVTALLATGESRQADLGVLRNLGPDKGGEVLAVKLVERLLRDGVKSSLEMAQSSKIGKGIFPDIVRQFDALGASRSKVHVVNG